eukprot:4792-Eustigmatos_ZCMA.PRE.1
MHGGTAVQGGRRRPGSQSVSQPSRYSHLTRCVCHVNLPATPSHPADSTSCTWACSPVDQGLGP